MVVYSAADYRRVPAPQGVYQRAVDIELPPGQTGLIGIAADAGDDAAKIQLLPRL